MLEDKIVQAALVEVLQAIYEVDFLGFSYGSRPGRSPHDALDALSVGIVRSKVNWVLSIDIRGFFDAIEHGWLVTFIEHRIADRRIVRLIQKWLKAGVLEDGRHIQSEMGSPQGASFSPLAANISLYYVFDLWAHQRRQRNCQGDVRLVRYVDDIVVGLRSVMKPSSFKRPYGSGLPSLVWTCTQRKPARLSSVASQGSDDASAVWVNRKAFTFWASRTSAGRLEGDGFRWNGKPFRSAFVPSSLRSKLSFGVECTSPSRYRGLGSDRWYWATIGTTAYRIMPRRCNDSARKLRDCGSAVSRGGVRKATSPGIVCSGMWTNGSQSPVSIIHILMNALAL